MKRRDPIIGIISITPPRTAGTRLRSLLPGLLLALGSIAGCHVGNFSASIDSNSKLPQFKFSAIPSQSEPPVVSIESIETGESIESIESIESGGSGGRIESDDDRASSAE